MAFKSPDNRRSHRHTKAAKPRSKRTPKNAPRKATKLFPFSTVRALARRAKARGDTVVSTNGCFDILHFGHVRYLEEARKCGDLLIVGVNSDASVRKNKGASRPIVPARERAYIIASLRSVDAVFIFNEKTPIRWLRALKPDVHVKGADRSLDQILERDTVEKNGGRVVRAKVVRGKSTTNIIGSIRKTYAKAPLEK